VRRDDAILELEKGVGSGRPGFELGRLFLGIVERAPDRVDYLPLKAPCATPRPLASRRLVPAVRRQIPLDQLTHIAERDFMASGMTSGSGRVWPAQLNLPIIFPDRLTGKIYRRQNARSVLMSGLRHR
jgi:hypothetical protein